MKTAQLAELLISSVCCTEVELGGDSAKASGCTLPEE